MRPSVDVNQVMTDVETGASSDVRAPVKTRWLALSLILVIVALGSGGYRYSVAWKSHRSEKDYRNRAYHKVLGAFFFAIQEERWDSAYEVTTPDFQNRVTRERFEDLARRYLEFYRRNALVLREAETGSTSTTRDIDGPETFKERYAVRAFAEGSKMIVSTTVLLDKDSIFYLRPPVPHVDDFSIQFVAPRW